MSDDKNKTIDGSVKPVLVKGADYFGVELDKDAKGKITTSVPDIKTAIKEMGVSDEDWVKWLDEEEAALKQIEEDKAKKAEAVEANGGKEEDTLLVKMNRKNPSMSIKGYNFTTRHPYQLVPVKDAEFIIQSYKGFSIALPSEVESFYGTK